MNYYVFETGGDGEPSRFDSNEDAARYIEEQIENSWEEKSFVVIKGERLTLETQKVTRVVLGGY